MMIRHTLLPLAVMMGFAVTAAAQPPGVKTELAPNAALQYWRAFALMPTPDKEQEKLLKDWNTVPLDDAAKKLADSAVSSLNCMRRASKMPKCDWGLDYDDGIGMLIPHLAKARDLARYGGLRIRLALARGDKAAARDDALALMAMARHVGRDPVLISVLVRFVIEDTVVDAIALYLPEIKASYAQCKKEFDALPAAVTAKQSVLAEKQFFIEWMIRVIKEQEAKKAGSGMVLWKELISGVEKTDTLKTVATIDDVLRYADALRPVYDELATLTDLPKKEFDAKYPEFMKKAKDANPMAASLLPSLDKVIAREHRHTARFALLLAAIAVAESGPDALKDHKDPFGDGPFTYRKLDKGFELSSKLIFDGKPVSLTAGK